MSITTLHSKARRAIAAGEYKFREAAEHLAAAKKLGASQRQSAKAIGKSPAWVNRLLKWRSGGYRETPFGPQSKAKRAAVQAPKRLRHSMTAEEAIAQTAQAEFQKARAVAVAAMFGDPRRIPGAARAELLKALAMLSSSRDTAAVLVERCRARLNLKWHDLLVAAEDENESPLRIATAA